MKSFILATAVFNLMISNCKSKLTGNKNLEDLLDVESFIDHTPFRSFDGLVEQSRIVGGMQTMRDRYPYQVALMQDDTQFCGGSLIDPEWVLSAAHCAGYVTNVHIGRFDLGDDSETYENIEVDYEIIHPEYDFTTQDNDFMLIKLQTPSAYPTVKLDDGSSDIFSGEDLTVMGWGKTSSFGPGSEVLLEVEVDFFPREKCNRRYNFRRGLDITNNMLCAARTGKDSCQGDSGGPLIKKGLMSSEDVQVGVVSWGIGCARFLLPGVYSRVSEARDFIDLYVPGLE